MQAARLELDPERHADPPRQRERGLAGDRLDNRVERDRAHRGEEPAEPAPDRVAAREAVRRDEEEREPDQVLGLEEGARPVRRRRRRHERERREGQHGKEERQPVPRPLGGIGQRQERRDDEQGEECVDGRDRHGQRQEEEAEENRDRTRRRRREPGRRHVQRLVRHPDSMHR